MSIQWIYLFFRNRGNLSKPPSERCQLNHLDTKPTSRGQPKCWTGLINESMATTAVAQAFSGVQFSEGAYVCRTSPVGIETGLPSGQPSDLTSGSCPQPHSVDLYLKGMESSKMHLVRFSLTRCREHLLGLSCGLF